MRGHMVPILIGFLLGVVLANRVGFLSKIAGNG